MAIVKTTFTGATLAAQAPELLAYLQANASGFFDEITADGDGNISCYVGDTIALLIGMDGTTTRKITLANGAYVETVGVVSADNPRSVTFDYAKKIGAGTGTANGILLVAKSAFLNSIDAGKMTFFITKNETGDTCIFGYIQTTTSAASTATYFFADIKNDNTIFKPLSSTSYAGRSALSKTMTTTALTPVVFNGGHYAPKAYIATFNQYALTECDLNIGGKSYISDGVCVLSD